MYYELPVETAISATVWDTWTTYTINFKLDEAADVTVGVTGTLAASSYCDLDNITLYSSNDTTTNLLSNGDFESCDTTQGWNDPTNYWTVNVGSDDEGWGSYTAAANSYASNNKTIYLDIEGNKSAMVTATVTQTVSLDAGNYTASIQVAGETGSSSLVFFADYAEDDDEEDNAD